MAISATYAYYAFGLGTSRLPDSLQSYGWLLYDYQQLHQACSAVLLPLTLGLTAFSKR